MKIKIIDRYLGVTIIQTTLLVLLLLMGLSVFITLVKEIGDIGTGNYKLLSAIEYVLLDLPRELYTFFPVASLLGILLGLGMLAGNNELTVMRASSMSIGRISLGTLKSALVLLILATVLGEGLAPLTEHTAESYKTLLTTSGQTLKTLHGVWVRDGQNFIYIRAIINGKQLQGVSRYQFDNQHNLIRASYAQSGEYRHGHWIMQNITTSQISPKLIQTQHSAKNEWRLIVNPDLLRISAVDPAEMSLIQLHHYLNYLKNNNLDTSSYALAFWQRIMQPLATLVMMWLAIPFVFGPLRRATMGLRILLGTAVGFIFITLNQFLGPLSTVYQLPPWLAAFIPIALFAGVAYLLQWRMR